MSLQARKASAPYRSRAWGSEPVSPGFGTHRRCSKMLKNEHLPFPSLPGRKVPRTFLLLLLSETKGGAMNVLQLHVTSTGVLDTEELAPAPVRGLGTRGMWEDRLSVREQLCTIFQKGKTVSKSSDSLLSLPALKNIYSTQASAHGAWIY